MTIAVHPRKFGGFDATTTVVDRRGDKCRLALRSPLVGKTQACVEALDMFQLTEAFFSPFPDPEESLSDVESIFETQQRSPETKNATTRCPGEKCFSNRKLG